MRQQRLILALAALLLVVGAGWIGTVYTGAGGDMTRAAERFVASLSADQRARALMAYDDPDRLDWHFIPKRQRKGLQLRQMNAQQRSRAHDLLHSGLSEVGYEKSTTIMSLEAILHEFEKSRTNGLVRDTERYYFTIFGQPSVQGRWGWSVEGHHLSLNFVVSNGDLIAATPAFFGANPATVFDNAGVGPKVGTRTLAKEEELAFDLLAALSPEQHKIALISEKAPRELQEAAERQPVSGPAVGLPAEKMSPAQRKALWRLLQAYVGNMPDETGKAWLGEIEQAGLAQVHFAWSGPSRPGVGHYYRVQGPTFVLEFVNVQRGGGGKPANHIHSVWRNLAGDFGLRI